MLHHIYEDSYNYMNLVQWIHIMCIDYWSPMITWSPMNAKLLSLLFCPESRLQATLSAGFHAVSAGFHAVSAGFHAVSDGCLAVCWLSGYACQLWVTWLVDALKVVSGCWTPVCVAEEVAMTWLFTLYLSSPTKSEKWKMILSVTNFCEAHLVNFQKLCPCLKLKADY